MAGLRHVRGVRPNRAADFRGSPFWTLKIPYKLTFILPLIAILTKEPEMLQPDAFCEHTMQQNATAAGVRGAYSALLDLLAGFKGPHIIILGRGG